MSQKTGILTNNAVRTSNPTLNLLCSSFIFVTWSLKSHL
jgi:hypothetical protein